MIHLIQPLQGLVIIVLISMNMIHPVQNIVCLRRSSLYNKLKALSQNSINYSFILNNCEGKKTIYITRSSGHYASFLLAPLEGFEDHWGIIS